ncbi:MAG: DHHA1 domain-containing protein [Pyrinomonadaceae bacterium]
MIKTERLYYKDSHLTDFDAVVVGVETSANGVVLDRTAFYPTGGGQPTDIGTLGESRVVECIDREDQGILHIIDGKPPEIGDAVRGRINWPRRLDHLQQHTAQHILSQALIELYGADTRAFRMLENTSEIDVALAEASAERIERAVERANQIIWENRPVHTRYVSADEARTLPLRKDSARQGELRIVEIEGFDMNACGGTHAHRTGEVGIVAVRSWERAKGLTRLEFVAGGRLLTDYRTANKVAKGVAAFFSVGRDNAPAAVTRLIEENKSLMRRLHDLEEMASQAEAETLLVEGVIRSTDGARVIARSFEHKELDELKRLAHILVERPGVVALLASSGDQNAARLVFARSANLPDDMNQTLRDTVSQLSGRGGGTTSFAQGGGLADAEKLHAIIDAIRIRTLGP